MSFDDAFKFLDIWQAENGCTDSEGVQWPSAESINDARQYLMVLQGLNQPCPWIVIDGIGGIAFETD